MPFICLLWFFFLLNAAFGIMKNTNAQRAADIFICIHTHWLWIAQANKFSAISFEELTEGCL